MPRYSRRPILPTSISVRDFRKSTFTTSKKDRHFVVCHKSLSFVGNATKSRFVDQAHSNCHKGQISSGGLFFRAQPSSNFLGRQPAPGALTSSGYPGDSNDSLPKVEVKTNVVCIQGMAHKAWILARPWALGFTAADHPAAVFLGGCLCSFGHGASSSSSQLYYCNLRPASMARCACCAGFSCTTPAPMLFDKARGVLRGHAGQGERAGGTGELSASGRVTLRQQRRQGRVIGAG